MKERLLRNWDLKLLAVLFSIILWLIVVNIDDPVKSVDFAGINVQILNPDVLAQEGKVYEVLDDSDVITVTVSGRRSVIEDISKENISAVADLASLKEGENALEIKVSSNKYASDIDGITSSVENVILNIEDLKKIQKSISVDVVGQVADGYILGDLNTNLNQVVIEGPESIVSTISTARAELNVSGVSANVSASAPIILYDENGNEVDTSRLTLNIKTVSITQEVLVTKYVVVSAESSGEPAEGYALTGDITVSPEMILIAGKKGAIDAVNSVIIPGTELDVTDLKSSLKATVDISAFLSDNVEVVDDNGSKVNVTVGIQKETFTNAIFSRNDITISGDTTGYDVEVVTDGTYLKDSGNVLKFYGLSDELAELNETGLAMDINMDDFKTGKGWDKLYPGTYWVVPVFNVPEGVHLNEDYKLQIKITTHKE